MTQSSGTHSRSRPGGRPSPSGGTVLRTVQALGWSLSVRRGTPSALAPPPLEEVGRRLLCRPSEHRPPTSRTWLAGELPASRQYSGGRGRTRHDHDHRASQAAQPVPEEPPAPLADRQRTRPPCGRSGPRRRPLVRPRAASQRPSPELLSPSVRMACPPERQRALTCENHPYIRTVPREHPYRTEAGRGRRSLSLPDPYRAPPSRPSAFSGRRPVGRCPVGQADYGIAMVWVRRRTLGASFIHRPPAPPPGAVGEGGPQSSRETYSPHRGPLNRPTRGRCSITS